MARRVASYVARIGVLAARARARVTGVAAVRSRHKAAAGGGKHRGCGGCSEARATSVDTGSRRATGGGCEALLGVAIGVAAGAPATKLVA